MMMMMRRSEEGTVGRRGPGAPCTICLVLRKVENAVSAQDRYFLRSLVNLEVKRIVLKDG